MLLASGMKRLLSLFVLLTFVAATYPWPAHAAKKLVVAVVANKHGGAASREIASSLRNAFSLDNRFHIIEQQLVGQVTNYYNGARQSTPFHFGAATTILARAQHHYFTMNYEDARAEATRAIDLLKKNPASINAKGQMLFDALMTKVLIARALKDEATLNAALAEAVRINAAQNLDRQTYPPSIVSVFNAMRTTRIAQGAGRLVVTTRPGVAEVYINGVMSGVTPLTLNDLPAGEYALMIRTNKYRPVTKRVSVAAGRTKRISERLDWIGNAGGGRRGVNGQNEIDEALRVASLMKADRAVLISAQPGSGGVNVARARLVDRQYKAAYRPIVVHYGTADRAQSLAEFAGEIAATLKRDLATDPAELADPHGTADPILLGKGKRKIYNSPIFWGVIGTAVAGGVAGGILAAMSGGGGGSGNVRVNFE